MSYPAMYEATRTRIAGLVADADPCAAAPACPAWTVKDVLAHLAAGAQSGA